MKKLLSVLLVMVFLSGCSAGISQEEYDKVVNEKKLLQENYDKMVDEKNVLQENYDQAITLKNDWTKKYQELQDEKADLQNKYDAVLAKSEADVNTTTPQEQAPNKQSDTSSQKQSATQNSSTSSQHNISGWIPYSTSDPETLLDCITKGYVVYVNGQYWASPEYVEMLKNTEVVYENDISPNAEEVDRYALANE